MPLLICPNDQSPMQEINRNGVMIDVCPQCRGVWMDRGELEKLMQLTSEQSSPQGGDTRNTAYRERDTRGGDRGYRDDRGYHDTRGDRDDRDYRDKRRRKKRFDLFDFFD